MIIVRLKGGLGNQMFQYALGRVLAIKNKTDLALDISFFDLKIKNITKRIYDLNIFNIEAMVLNRNKMIAHLYSLFRKIIKTGGTEKDFNFNPNVLSLGPNAYLDGHWQSPKYFTGFEDVIRRDFTFKNPPSQNILILANEIKNKNSLCIHVRRGDYVGNKYHEVVDNKYYEKGIEYISGKTSIEKIYVFSDDINWCRNNLKFEFTTMFIDDEYAGKKGEGHMYLMSKCKNFIIANSSFSWWAVWLCDFKEKIVVCPKQWFPDTSIDTSDLIPVDWIRI